MNNVIIIFHIIKSILKYSVHLIKINLFLIIIYKYSESSIILKPLRFNKKKNTLF